MPPRHPTPPATRVRLLRRLLARFDGPLTDRRVLAVEALEERSQPSATAADILFTTKGNVTGSSTPGLSSWTQSQVVQVGAPNFAAEPGTSGGTFSPVFDLRNFSGDPVRIDALHMVRNQVTVGSGSAALTLLPGDLLLSPDNNATLNGTNGPLAVADDEVAVFRPSAAGDYSAGSFFMLLDNFGSITGASKTWGVTVAEAGTLVGDYFVRQGTILYTRDGWSQDGQINIFTPTGVGAGRTAGTTAVLIDGEADLGMGPAIRGLDLVAAPTAVAGVPLAAGTLVLALDSSASVGSNGLSVTPTDVFTLAVTKTTLVAGRAVANASLLFQGSDAGLSTSSNNSQFLAVTLGATNSPPAANPDGYSTNEDTPLTLSAAGGVLPNDTDPDGDALSVAGFTPPARGTLALNPDGSFTYTPDANYNGPDSFTYTVSDGKGGTATATVTLTVAPVNDPPVANDDRYSTAINLIILSTPLSVGVPGVLGNDTDVDGDTIRAELVSGPANGTLTFNSDGSFTYTALLNFSGTDSFTYRAFDGSAYSAPATVYINVSSPNQAPTATGDSYATAEDIPLAVAAPGVLSNDNDPDGDTLAAVLDSGTTYGTLTFRSDGRFTYTPFANYNGPDSFTYHATDGSLDSGAVTVSLTVSPVNDPPAANDDPATTAEDNSVTISVLANDTDAEGDPLTVTAVGPALYGTVTTNGTTVTYTPFPNYNGPDSFTYTVSDGRGGTATATVRPTVTPVNDAPVASNDSYFTNLNTPLSVPPIGVIANDTDVDGDPLSAVLVRGPSNGTLAFNSDGSFTYTPGPGFTGTDSFTYFVTDGQAFSAAATVSVAVLPPNGRPVASNDDSYAVSAGSVLVVPAAGVLANDTGSGIGTLRASLVNGPSYGTLTLNANGSFTYTPAVVFSVTDSFNYKATDGSGTTGTAHVVITVQGVNVAPTATADSYTTARDTTLAVPPSGTLANDADANGDVLNAVLVSGTQHGTLQLNPDGSFVYTPDPGFEGTDSFTYQAVDPFGATSGTVTVTLTVTAPAPPPPSSPPAPSPPPVPGPGSGTGTGGSPAPSSPPPAPSGGPVNPPASPALGPPAIGGVDASVAVSFVATTTGSVADVIRPTVTTTLSGAGVAQTTAAVAYMGGAGSPAAAAGLPPGDAKPPLGEAPSSALKSAPPEAPPAAAPVPASPAVTGGIPDRPVTVAPVPSPEPPDADVAVESVREGLDRVSRDVEGEVEERAATDAAVTTVAVATAGYVLLNTRAVYWFISALLARPAVWRRFDPIDVIYSWEKGEGLGTAPEAAPDDESLQSMVG